MQDTSTTIITDAAIQHESTVISAEKIQQWNQFLKPIMNLS